MYFVNSLTSIFILCFITRVQSDNYDDAPPAFIQQNGQNMCCYFVFDYEVDLNTLIERAGNVEFYAKACLPGHKLVFVANGSLSFGTIAEDPNVNLEGLTYLLSEEDYANLVKVDTLNKCTGEKIAYAVTESVQVNMDGQDTTIKCNTFLAAGLPPKTPCKSEIKSLSATFQAAGFTQQYIDAFGQTPSDETC